MNFHVKISMLLRNKVVKLFHPCTDECARLCSITGLLYLTSYYWLFYEDITEMKFAL